MDSKPLIEISTVKDGTMSLHSDPTNAEMVHNREKWLAQFGISLDDVVRVFVTYDRDDFDQFQAVTISDRGHGMRDNHLHPADALATKDPNVTLFLPIADCVGTVIYDPVKNVIMLSHLGRHSLEQSGGQKSVAFLVDKYGSNPHDLLAWLSPSPSAEHYPVHAFDDKSLAEVATWQLEKAGIQSKNITTSKIDTATDPNYFSHSEFLKGNKPTDGRYAIIARLPRPVK